MRRPSRARVRGLEALRAMLDDLTILRPLHRPMPPALPGDWLDEHDEPGQTLAQFRRDNRRKLTTQRQVLVVQPLGEFLPEQRDLLRSVARYLRSFFGLAVRTEATLPLRDLPRHACRQGPEGEQLLSTFLLDDVLRPRLPRDAVASLAFVATDLWPGRGWNFVFGQASLSERVGVWSLARLGHSRHRSTLQRARKLASHEAGHLLGMEHCASFWCNLAGANHLEEADRHPSWLCPECLGKVCWLTGRPAGEALARLSAFCRGEGMAREAAFYRACLRALRGA